MGGAVTWAALTVSGWVVDCPFNSVWSITFSPFRISADLCEVLTSTGKNHPAAKPLKKAQESPRQYSAALTWDQRELQMRFADDPW